MKIVSLNVRHGGGDRQDDLARHLVGYRADVLVLPEYRPAGSAVLRVALMEAGYTHFAAAGVEPHINTVAIFARSSFVPRTYPALPPEDRVRLFSAHFGNLGIYGVYFANNDAKGPLFDFLLEHGHTPTESAYCLIGDFNTGCQKLDREGVRFKHADKFKTLAEERLVDSWRVRNPDERQYTWMSNTGNGFRLDHVLCSPDADRAVRTVEYDHGVREVGATDHSAVIVEFDL